MPQTWGEHAEPFRGFHRLDALKTKLTNMLSFANSRKEKGFLIYDFRFTSYDWGGFTFFNRKSSWILLASLREIASLSS